MNAVASHESKGGCPFGVNCNMASLRLTDTVEMSNDDSHSEDVASHVMTITPCEVDSILDFDIVKCCSDQRQYRIL